MHASTDSCSDPDDYHATSSTLVHDEALRRKAVLHSRWRSVGVKSVLVLAVVVCCLALQITSGNRSWLLGACANATARGISFPIALYGVHYRNTLEKFRAMGQPKAQLTVSEDTFSLSSEAIRDLSREGVSGLKSSTETGVYSYK